MKSFFKLLLTFLALFLVNLEASNIVQCEEKYNKCIAHCDDNEADESCFSKCEQDFDKCAPEATTEETAEDSEEESEER